MIELGYSSIIKPRLRRRLSGEFSSQKNCLHVEHRRTELLKSGVTPAEPWLLELCDNYVFSDVNGTDLMRKRVEFYPYGLEVTLMDGDTVSETNCVRQPFSWSDVGQNKATILINRINLF